MLEPAGDIDGPPLYLKWNPIDQADSYEVKIIDEYLTVVARFDPNPLTNDSVRIPEEVRSRFKPGITYIWIVEAFNDAHEKIAEAEKHFVIH